MRRSAAGDARALRRPVLGDRPRTLNVRIRGGRGRLNDGSNEGDDTLCCVASPDSIFPAVEIRRNQIFCGEERQLAVASQAARRLGQIVDRLVQGDWQAIAFRPQDVRDVMDTRWFDTGRAKQSFEREFDHLLRLANDISPAF